MRRSLSVVLCGALLLALALPGAALGKGSENKTNKGRSNKSADSATHEQPGKGHPASSSASRSGKPAEKAANKAAKQETKQAKTDAKSKVKAEVAVKAKAKKYHGPAAVMATTGSVDPGADTSPSVEATHTGIPNAFDHVTRNLERSLAKIAAGTKKQLPPGLVRVWLKFAGWLGVDPTLQPGYVAPPAEPTSTVEPTSTPEPTSTVEPTGTPEPTPTVEPVGPPNQ